MTPQSIKILVGVQPDHPKIIRHILDQGQTPLISANACWRPRTRSWHVPSALVGRCVLDSGGFNALRVHGCYRFCDEEYLDLVSQLKPLWYAQRDYCCEEEITNDPLGMVELTARRYSSIQAASRRRQLPTPTPVLQGRSLHQYQLSWFYLQCLARWNSFTIPDLIAVGSVCRKPHNRVLETVRSLAFLPDRHRLHLFGVKGSSLPFLDPSIVASTDSQAWSYAARVKARNLNVPCTQAFRIQALDEWVAANSPSTYQPSLL